LSICVCVLNFADDRRKFESDYQKTNPVGGASRSGFNRWFDVSRPPSGDQFPANLLASGIVRIQQLAKTSMVFRKYFFRSLEPGPDIRGPRLGTRLLSAFQDVNKKVGKKSAGENSFSQPRKSRRKGDKNRHPGRGFFRTRIRLCAAHAAQGFAFMLRVKSSITFPANSVYMSPSRWLDSRVWHPNSLISIPMAA
jgi:hypothetical protein